MPRLGMAKSSAQERRAAWLRGFEESGLSVAEFCRREGLAYSTVLNWRRRAREEASASVAVSPDFVVVEALPPEPEPPAVSGREECGERSAPAGDPARRGGFGMRDKDMAPEAGVVFQSCPAGGRAGPPLRVELLLPGRMVLRIFGGCPDRGGGGGCQERTAMKGGAP